MFQLYLSTAGLLNILKHLFWGCNLFLRILCVHGGTEESWHAVSFSQSAGNQPTRLPPSTTSCEPAPMPQCHHHWLPNTSYCPHPSSFSSVAYGRQRVPAPLSPHFSGPFLRLFSLLFFVGFEASAMGRLCGSKGGGVWLVKARGAWQVCPPYQSEWLYMYYGMYAGVCRCVFVLNSTKLKSFVCTMKDFNICSLYSSTWFPSRWHVDRKYRPFFLLATIEYKIGSRFQFSHWAKGIFKIRSIYFTAKYN